MKKQALTDFNDLHVTEGLDAVAKQINDALEVFKIETPASGEPPVSPVNEMARMTIEYALQRFSLAMPNARIWDAEEKKLLKQQAVKIWWGAKLFKQWHEHEKRADVDENYVLVVAAAAQDGGRGELGAALARYIYLYPTDSVFDMALRQIVPIGALKIAIADVYDQWVKHIRRREINRDDLVFDPGGPWEKEGRINMFRGLPMKPAGTVDDCQNIRALLWHLCNKNDEVFEWLCKWLAYPLQNIGAKMATAVIMHSEIQGTGKSLLFDEVLRRIYGDYGTTLGQHQLESQYTDWRSQKLFLLFEEIFSRDQKYAHTGTVKHMITGRTHRIEKKFISGWEEANHSNAVFLSNEFQPWPIEPSDRRMLVVWPEKKLPEEIRVGVLREIHHSKGVQAFYRWLLSRDLTGFHTHSEPPMTDAKQRLIDFGRPGWELFWRDWSFGALEVPFATCLVNDLYEVYKQWCNKAGERHLSRERFSGFISAKISRKRDVHYSVGQGTKKGTFFIVGDKPDDKPMKDWLAESIRTFQNAMQKGDD